MADAGVDVVLFDLGGVLLEVAGVGAMRELAGIDNDDELWRRWLACEWVRRFERGHCSPDEFAAGVVHDWQLATDPQLFLDAFAAWPTGPYDGTEALLDEVGARAALGCLSNTNALHWDLHFSRWPLFERFDHAFLSFDLGMVKPDRETFDHVAEALAVAADQILFLDDNLINVEGAVAAGFRGVHVRGLDETRRALTEAGLSA
ncbi:MAG: HAD family hydrolase [Acidimicrobiales bacterium]